MATLKTDARSGPDAGNGEVDAARALEDARARLLAALDQPDPDEPEGHPYEELARKYGYGTDLAGALIAVDEAQAEQIWEAIDCGEVEMSRAEHCDEDVWSASLAEGAARDEAAIAHGGWHEVARREQRTFGQPRLLTVVRLASLRLQPLLTVRPRPREAARGSRRARGVRHRSARGDPPPDGDPDEPPRADCRALERTARVVVARHRQPTGAADAVDELRAGGRSEA